MNKATLLKAIGGAAAAGALVAAVPALAASTSTSSSSTSSSSSSSATPHVPRWHDGYAPGANGEKALTGSALTSASNAAVAAVPGGKVSRASTEADGTVSGATYEVHVTKSNGSHVVVIENASFKVLGVQSGGSGHCAGGPGGNGARGAVDYGAPQGGQFQGANLPGGPPQGGPNI